MPEKESPDDDHANDHYSSDGSSFSQMGFILSGQEAINGGVTAYK